MSDRIPGSSWDNPIWHGKWRIYAADCGPTPFRYAYAHDDCDGDGDSRQGHTRSVAHAMNEIDAWEDEHRPIADQAPNVGEASTE